MAINVARLSSQKIENNVLKSGRFAVLEVFLVALFRADDLDVFVARLVEGLLVDVFFFSAI